MESNQWYMEYKIHKNRPGLLGDIASVLGMLEVNILTINGLKAKLAECWKRMMKKNYPDGQNVKQNEKYYGNSLETAKTGRYFGCPTWTIY